MADEVAISFPFTTRRRLGRFGSALAISAASRSARMRSNSNRYRLVVGVLGHQLAGEGLFEDALAHLVGALQAGLHRRFRLLDHRKSPLHLSHDAPLLHQGREGDRHLLQI